jgi:hypothetical protein
MIERVSEECGTCGQVDDHPKHRVFENGTWAVRHMDCCSSVGCTDNSCGVILQKAAGARGPDLIRFLTQQNKEDK